MNAPSRMIESDIRTIANNLCSPVSLLLFGVKTYRYIMTGEGWIGLGAGLIVYIIIYYLIIVRPDLLFDGPENDPGGRHRLRRRVREIFDPEED